MAGATPSFSFRVIAALPFLLCVFNYGSAQSTPPRGCGPNLLSAYFNLCDLDAVWGIVLEAFAALGVVTSLVLVLVLLGFTPFIVDGRKKASVPIHCIFLLGTMGIFGLTFAFIIKFDQRTCPTRIFLWGVLFAVCFSCLLAQVWRVLKLVRSGDGPSGCCMVAVVLCLTLVQVIIDIEFLVLLTYRMKQDCYYTSTDFTMLLIYVMFLMALTFFLSMFTFCGRYHKWKKYGVHVFVTMLLSIAIWVVWIVMLVRGNAALGKRPLWDDPTLSIALVANGWVFLLFYSIPQLRHITCPAKPEDGPLEAVPPNLHSGVMGGVDNRAFTYEEPNTGEICHDSSQHCLLASLQQLHRNGEQYVQRAARVYNPSATDEEQLLPVAFPTRSLSQLSDQTDSVLELLGPVGRPGRLLVPRGALPATNHSPTLSDD